MEQRCTQLLQAMYVYAQENPKLRYMYDLLTKIINQI